MIFVPATTTADGSETNSNNTSTITEESGNRDDNIPSPPPPPPLPPWSTCVTHLRYGFNVAIWPFVFFLFNGIICYNLLWVDEYMNMMQNGSTEDRYHRYHYFVSRLREHGHSRASYVAANWMKHDSLLLLSILLFIDAILLHRCAGVVEKEVAMLDDSRRNDDGAVEDEQIEGPTPTPQQGSYNNKYKYGLLSRSMDNVLLNDGHHTTTTSPHQPPHKSILISLLFLGTVFCASLGCVAFSIGCFARATKGREICSVPDVTCIELQHSDTKHIGGLPDEIQAWAQNHFLIAHVGPTRFTREVVKMVDGTIFFVGQNERDSFNSSEQKSASLFLASISPDGSIEYHPEFRNPTSFTNIEGKDQLSSAFFCCLYGERDHIEERNVSKRAIMCTPGRKRLTSAEVPFWTAPVPAIVDVDVGYYRAMSLIVLNGTIWAKQEFTVAYSEGKDIMWTEYYNIIPDESGIQIRTVSRVKHENTRPRLGSLCALRLHVISALVLVTTMIIGSYWLVAQRRIPAGIVPVCCAFIFVCCYITRDGAIAVNIAAISLTLLALVAVIPIPSMLGREGCIWILYTAIILCPLVRNVRPAATVVGVLLCAAVGVILDHPTLCVMGWIGGIGTILAGIGFYVVGDHETASLCTGLGLVFGAGGVSVGLFLIKCRQYASFYLRRAMFDGLIAYTHVKSNFHIYFAFLH